MASERLSENSNVEEKVDVAEYPEFNPDAAQKLIDAEKRKQEERAVGAKVLTAAGFVEHNKEIVTSSFDKAREAGKKLVGNNTGRRNDAYVTRIEGIIDKYGPDAEQKMWGMAANSEDLLIEQENIPEAYWESQRKAKRDAGAPEELSEWEKEAYADDIRWNQKDSIGRWADYLGREDCPYPMWYKLFVWDGVTRMSAVHETGSDHYAKRDETTVAGYPFLNPAALAKIYDSICRINGLDEFATLKEQEVDEGLAKGLNSYNFNRMYTFFNITQRRFVEVPKNPEDIKGDWLEYLPGDEERIAEAAAATPWCVASPTVAKSYLNKGQYGTGDIEKNTESKAKFILFHLHDEKTGALSESACASIRLDPNGEVAEISGVLDGQVLHDSLIPTVEEKVKTLPGGEKYLKAFADKHELMRLDEKMKNGEELTKDELRFIYEIDRPINRLAQFGADPRISEAKEKYPVNKLIEMGVIELKDARKMVKDGAEIKDVSSFVKSGIKLSEVLKSDNIAFQDIGKMLDEGMRHKDVFKLIEQTVGIHWAADNFDYLAAHGVKPTEIAKRMTKTEKLRHLDFLDKANIPYNINRLVRANCRSGDGASILAKEDEILKRGGKINYKSLAKASYFGDIISYADTFCAHGLQRVVAKAVERLDEEEGEGNESFFLESLGVLAKNGIKVRDVAKKVDVESRKEKTNTLIENLDEILAYGIEPEIDMEKFEFNKKVIEVMARHPERFDLQALYEKDKIPMGAVLDSIDILTEHGVKVDIEGIFKKLPPELRIEQSEKLAKYGVTVNLEEEVKRLDDGGVFYLLLTHQLEKLKKMGIDISGAVAKMDTHSFAFYMRPMVWRLGYGK
jgi:hypothetical protein